MSNLLRTISFAATGVALFAAPPVAAAPWAAPKVIDDSPGSAHEVTDLQVASEVDGDLTAAWIGSSPGARQVYTATRPRGGAWSAPTAIGGSAQAGSTDLTLRVNAEGAAIAGWYERRSYRNSTLVTVTRSATSGAWSTAKDAQPPSPFPSAPGFTNTSALGLLPSGGALAVWQRSFREELHGDLRGQESAGAYLPATGGGGWLSETAPDVRRPRIGIDIDGNAILADVDVAGDVVVSTRPSGGTWSTPQTIGTPGVERTSSTQLATNARGEAVLAWTRLTPELVHELRVARRAPDGTWSAPVTIASQQGGQSEPDGLYDPKVGLDASGRATVLWARFTVGADDFTTKLETASAASGAAFGASTVLTTRVQSPKGEGSYVPGIPFTDLSVASTGYSLATWLDGAKAFAATRGKGAWSTTQTIATTGELGFRGPVDGEVTSDHKATVVVADPAKVVSVTADISEEPVQVGRALPVNAALASWTGRCPLTATAYVNGKSAKLNLSDRGSTKYRCLYGALVPQPASAKVGSTALVLVSGNGLFPTIVSAKVIAEG